MKQNFARLAALAISTTAVSANAVLDVSAATGAIGDAGTAVAVVGGAAFIVMIGIKVWKWLARAA